MSELSKDSENSGGLKPLREVPPQYDFELPVEPGYHEEPPEGTWEDGYHLSLMALELIKNRPEVWEERERRRCDVEFIL